MLNGRDPIYTKRWESSTIFMIFTRKDGDLSWWTVSWSGRVLTWDLSVAGVMGHGSCPPILRGDEKTKSKWQNSRWIFLFPSCIVFWVGNFYTVQKFNSEFTPWWDWKTILQHFKGRTAVKLQVGIMTPCFHLHPFSQRELGALGFRGRFDRAEVGATAPGQMATTEARRLGGWATT